MHIYIYTNVIEFRDPNSLEFDNPRTKEGVVVKRSIVYDQCLYKITCSYKIHKLSTPGRSVKYRLKVPIVVNISYK